MIQSNGSEPEVATNVGKLLRANESCCVDYAAEAVKNAEVRVARNVMSSGCDRAEAPRPVCGRACLAA